MKLKATSIFMVVQPLSPCSHPIKYLPLLLCHICAPSPSLLHTSRVSADSVSRSVARASTIPSMLHGTWVILCVCPLTLSPHASRTAAVMILVWLELRTMLACGVGCPRRQQMVKVSKERAKMKVTELKEELSTWSLATSGPKPWLVRRLHAVIVRSHF